MGEACRKFNTPVTGGNVSFYNQNPEGPVYPTPTIGMVGIIDDLKTQMTLNYKNEGDLIVLLGKQQNDIGSSEYIHKIKNIEYSAVPHFDMEAEFALQQFVAAVNKDGLLQSAHDISEGGLLVTLVEKGFFQLLGFEVTANYDGIRKDAYWFGEAQSRIVVTVKKGDIEQLKSRLNAENIAYTVLGTVTAGELKINGENWGHIVDWKDKYDTAIEKKLTIHE